MKTLSLVLGLALASLLPAMAQVTVEVSMDQRYFLVGEAIPAAVLVKNRSGQMLTLGKDPYWLTFSMEASKGIVVGKNDDVPVQGEFTLESSQMATKRVNLEPSFVLSQPGRYEVTATVHIKDWGKDISSAPMPFDIVEGAKIWSQKFGVPLPPGVSNGIPEVRKYCLEQANYLRRQLRLYLRLTDEDSTRVFKVTPIGPMVSFGQPEAQLDKVSNLHLLYQYGARAFSYTVFNPDGELLIRQTYDYASTRPKLKKDNEGYVLVAGGLRRVASTDVPEPKPSDVLPEIEP